MQGHFPYSAGPRLTDTPHGDPAAQAVASLRGYAYQLYSSALAWLDLKPGQELYLEVAKDYAVVAGNALRAVEVKDTSATPVTLNSADIRQTLDAFVDLVERNPQKSVRLRFLSTSPIGKERKNDHRISGEAALIYWRRAAAGADVTPLRGVLARISLTDRVRSLIQSYSDDEFREYFLKRIHWDCGQASLDDLSKELAVSLIRYAAGPSGIPSSEAPRLAANLLQHLMLTIVQSSMRRLTDTDLKILLDEATRISVPRSAVDDFLRGAHQRVAEGDGEGTSLTPIVHVLDAEADMPLPELMAARPAIVANLLERICAVGFAFITGGTGRGKTLLARLAARSHGGQWYVLDLRNASAAQTIQRLELALSALGVSGANGVILDDLNELEEPAVCKALGRFIRALHRRDILCLATAYRPPSARSSTELGIVNAASITAPNLTIDEVGALITSAGGGADQWSRAMYFASGGGHPQLVQAMIRGFRSRAWPSEELRRLREFKSTDAEAEQQATRHRLVSTVPDEARNLLYRLSILIGRFDRALGINLAALEPPIRSPGEQLDLLVGPWVEPIGQAQLRMSPLLANAGRENLTPDEQIAVHRSAAETIMAGRRINVIDADAGFFHALLGKSEAALLKIAHGVLKANENTRRHLSEGLTGLRLCRNDQPIYPDNLSVSRLLRFAQFLLVGQRADVRGARKCWETLQKELKKDPDVEARESFEFFVLARMLIDQATAGKIQDWVGSILRFQELSTKKRSRRAIFETMGQPIEGRTGNTALGLLFILQAMGIPGIIDLKAVFDQLDRLTPDQRQILFADLQAMPNDFALFVSSAWLAETRHSSIDGRASAELYLRMAKQAHAWGYRNLATRCQVARSIMLDEYADDPTAALQALDGAIQELGGDSVLSRARAKVLYRRKDHAGALELLRNVAEDPNWGDPIERAYLLREAAISAAELGDWSEARKWFAAGSGAAGSAFSDEMKLMGIGLRADQAVAAYKSRDPNSALREMGGVLDDLARIDPKRSRKAEYCHRVVRHSCLWLFGEATETKVVVDEQPAAIAPGICSNPEPPDLTDLPLGPLKVAWYLLAQAEVALGVEANIKARLKKHLEGRSVPIWEMSFCCLQLAYDIRHLNHDRFVQTLPQWVDSQVYFAASRDRLLREDAMNPVFGETPRASADDLATSNAIFAAEDALLAFGMAAVWSMKQPSVASLSAAWRAHDNRYPGGAVVYAMAGGGVSNGERLEDGIATQIHKPSLANSYTPEEVFIASLWFIQLVPRSNFKRHLIPQFEKWTRDRWTFVIEEQRFLLKAPTVTGLAIERALSSPDEGLKYIANLLLAAEPAVQTQLHPNFRQMLSSL